jgi:hypothetical protein
MLNLNNDIHCWDSSKTYEQSCLQIYKERGFLQTKQQYPLITVKTSIYLKYIEVVSEQHPVRGLCYDYEGEASQDPSQYTPTPQNSLNSRKRQEEPPERSLAKRGSKYVVSMILTL